MRHALEAGGVGVRRLQQRLDRRPTPCATRCRAGGGSRSPRRARGGSARSPTGTPGSSTTREERRPARPAPRTSRPGSPGPGTPTAACATRSAPAGPSPGRRPTRTSTRPWPCATTPQAGQPISVGSDSTVDRRAGRRRPGRRRSRAARPGRPAGRNGRSSRPRARQHDVGSLIVEVLAIRRGKSPLILGDLDPSPPQPTPRRAVLTPHSSVKSPFAVLVNLKVVSSTDPGRRQTGERGARGSQSRCRVGWVYSGASLRRVRRRPAWRRVRAVLPL